MKLFIGLDVSLAKTAVCVINEHGKILGKLRLPANRKLTQALQARCLEQLQL